MVQDSKQEGMEEKADEEHKEAIEHAIEYLDGFMKQATEEIAYEKKQAELMAADHAQELRAFVAVLEADLVLLKKHQDVRLRVGRLADAHAGAQGGASGAGGGYHRAGGSARGGGCGCEGGGGCGTF